jgi:hypothetical protein
MIFVGEPEGKKSLGRTRYSWVHDIKMALSVIGWGGMGSIDLTQGPVRSLMRNFITFILHQV